VVRQRADAKQARYRSGGPLYDDESTDLFPPGKENAIKGELDLNTERIKPPIKAGVAVKRDFFGRVIVNQATVTASSEEIKVNNRKKTVEGNRIWVTYNEGFSNAVRKPITLADIMRGL
jgi:hypothetical protein